MIRYITIAFLLIMLLLSSCATLLDEKGQKTKGIFIASNVPDAKVFNSKNQLIGTTPFLYNPSKSIGLQTLTIEKDQYESQKITIEKKEKVVKRRVLICNYHTTSSILETYCINSFCINSFKNLQRRK